MMNRRTFLTRAFGAVGVAASWRVGYEMPRQWIIPPGVDALVPQLPIPSVTQIAPEGDVQAVVAYFEREQARIVRLLDDVERAAAFFVMYTIHISKPYGAAPMVDDLASFVALDRAHCGDYSRAQLQISRALGLHARLCQFTDGWHGWVEVQIAGHWELFDSTGNLWINQPMDALISGADRRYRVFYAPMLDPNAPDIYRAHLQEGPYPGYYDVSILRRREPYFGKESGTHFAPIEIVKESL